MENSIKKFLLVLASLLFSCLAYSVELPDGYRPTALDGVKLSATVSKSIFKVGSTNVLTSSLVNLSTNSIRVDTTSPNVQMSELYIYVMDGDGKSYRLTPDFRQYFGAHIMTIISPQGSLKETNTITFGAQLKPGEYTLRTERIFSVGEMPFLVKAEPIKIRVTK